MKYDKLTRLKKKLRSLDVACAFIGFMGVFIGILEVNVLFKSHSSSSSTLMESLIGIR